MAATRNLVRFVGSPFGVEALWIEEGYGIWFSRDRELRTREPGPSVDVIRSLVGTLQEFVDKA